MRSASAKLVRAGSLHSEDHVLGIQTPEGSRDLADPTPQAHNAPRALWRLVHCHLLTVYTAGSGERNGFDLGRKPAQGVVVG